jgi:tRNA(fMet)-specific endonuclease VapC
MRYLLDTNIFIAAMKGVDIVRERLERTALPDLVLSPVVLGELALGVEKSAHRERNAARLARLADQLELAPLDGAVSQHYARIRAQLERGGTPIGANDLWIAAQGLALGAVVVTDNLAEFRRVPGLLTENWLGPERR